MFSDDMRCETIERVDNKLTVDRLMAGLTPREERVLRMTFGLGGTGCWQQKEVAAEFGVSQTRIQQVVAKALRKCRLRAGYRTLEQLRAQLDEDRGQEHKEPPITWHETARILSAFPHCDKEIVLAAGREFMAWGRDDAEGRGISPIEWLWRRSRKMAGCSGTTQQSLAALSEHLKSVRSGALERAMHKINARESV